MDEHISHLVKLTGSLDHAKILDLGSGSGSFLFAAHKRGLDAVGLEVNPAYIAKTLAEANRLGVPIEVTQGYGEKLPYADETFALVNMSEVIEHVQDPKATMREVYRVLIAGGHAYVSVPNRFGMKDPHYRLYIVNWIPRIFSDAFIRVFGKEKEYGDESAGKQRLQEMHYYTLGAVSTLFKETGFAVIDIRKYRIATEYSGLRKWVLMTIYLVIRPWYFDSFHVLLTKP
jgi:ubiquinone/menaquinone biosynthesis C-methylase UbiE